MFLKILQNSQDNTCAQVSFLIKMTRAQFFSCKFCEISKNTLFTEHLRATASDYGRKTSIFRTKNLRINALAIIALIMRSRYLPRFLKYRKNNSNGHFLVSYKEKTVILDIIKTGVAVQL